MLDIDSVGFEYSHGIEKEHRLSAIDAGSNEDTRITIRACMIVPGILLSFIFKT